MDALRTTAATLATACALLAVWAFATGPGGIPPTVLPAPLDVLRSLRAGLIEGQLWPHILFTTRAALTGLVIGAALGLAFGALVIMMPALEAFVMPIIVGMQSVPKIAVAPILIAYLGFGIQSKIFTAAVLCFFPVFVAAVTGMRSISPALLDLYRVASASRLHVLVHARLPAAAPYLFSSFQIAVVLSLIGSVVSEFVASTQGLGYVVRARSQDLDVSMMFAAIAILSGLGVLGSLAVRLAQERIVFWQRM